MTKIREKIRHFEVELLKGVSVTHGYGISNSFPVHFHASYNLGIIELGERNFFYRGENIILKPGDIFIVQPFEPHYCKPNYHTQNYKIISFFLDHYYYFPQLVIPHQELFDKIIKFHALAEYEKDSKEIVRVFTEILEITKTFGNYAAMGTLEKEQSLEIELARKYIEENCHLDLSLKKMADIACVSEFHFNRYFHKSYGLSPYAYYIVCKLKKAQKSLIDQKSVLAATYDHGFFDQSHFTKLFKKHVGVTPGKFLCDNV